MESDGEDLENIFEEYENNENDVGAENTENKSSSETPGAVKIAPRKRIVKNPRLKFNAERLCGERGIPVLVDHFKNVKFKGQGHEKEDLDKLISKLEHWAHRLFPSMKFEDCLTHIERLGKKRPVQTCLRKIRLDMPILNSDFVKDNEDDDVKRMDDDDDAEPEEISAFDRLLGENGETSSIDVSAPENVTDLSSFNFSPTPHGSRSYVLGSSFGSSLSEEQKERMERNRMLAAERRKARLAAMEQNTGISPPKNQETIVSESVFNGQNSLNKFPDSSEFNDQSTKNCNSSMEISREFEENSKVSSNLSNENPEKLGLDDLMNLVDEEDPVSNENAVEAKQIESVSGTTNDTNKLQSAGISHPENQEKIVSESVFNGQKSLNKLPDSSEFNKQSTENCNSSMEISDELEENSKVSLNLSNENSKKLGLDDLMNLVDDEDSVSNENVVATKQIESVSGSANETNKLQQDNAKSFEDFNNVSKNTENKLLLSSENSEKFPEQSIESTSDIICETSVDSQAITNCTVKCMPVDDENVIVENKDSSCMDCEDANS